MLRSVFTGPQSFFDLAHFGILIDICWKKTFLKKVIWEKSYFLESSKVLGLIKPKWKAYRKKWD